MIMSTEAQPARPLEDQSISDLVHTFNEKCLATRRLGFCGREFPLEPEDDDDDFSPLPNTFLKPPAQPTAIHALERRLRSRRWGFADGLPTDYVDFLQITNGIYAADEESAADNSEIFRPVEEVTLEQDAVWDCALISDEILADLDIDVEWPSVENAVQLGAGGDEGQQLLVPPAKTKEALGALHEVYNTGDADLKQRIELAATRIYGSWENLQNLKVAVLRAYHWAAEIEAFASFKHLLESHVIEIEKERSDDNARRGEDGEDDDDDDSEDALGDGCDTTNESSADESKSPGKKRKTFQEGKPGTLDGLKLLFTGTFDSMDRKTCEATARDHGAKITGKLGGADYIVLGMNAGPKKIAEIKEKGLRTINEQGFRDLLAGKAFSKKTQAKDENSDESQSKRRKSMPVRQFSKERVAELLKMSDAHSLKGKKILITGTLEKMDRKTAKSVAEQNGAQVVTSLDKTDFIVLGVNAGPKKLKEIEAKGLRTVTEAEFHTLTGFF